MESQCGHSDISGALNTAIKACTVDAPVGFTVCRVMLVLDRNQWDDVKHGFCDIAGGQQKNPDLVELLNRAYQEYEVEG